MTTLAIIAASIVAALLGAGFVAWLFLSILAAILGGLYE